MPHALRWSADTASAAVVVKLFCGPSTPGDGWLPGPLPVAIPEWVLAEGFSTSPVTDRTTRGTYFFPPVLVALNGTDATPMRWWRPADVEIDGAHVRAVEVLHIVGQAGRALAVMHAQLPQGRASAVKSLRALARAPRTAARAGLTSLLPTGHHLVDEHTIGTCVSFTPSREPDEDDLPNLDLWELASATPLATFRPTTSVLATVDFIELSADWSAMVLRDGVAFGTRADVGRFGEQARTLVHSVYLDVFLLAHIQASFVADVTSRVATADLSGDDVGALIDLERSVLDFRRIVWTTAAGGSAHANQLLDALQRQLDLVRRVGALVADVADSSRLVQSVTSARTSAALALVSVLGVPFGVCYAAAALVPSAGWWPFPISTVVASLGALVLSRSSWLRPGRRGPLQNR